MLQAECVPVPIGLYTKELPSSYSEHVLALMGIDAVVLAIPCQAKVFGSNSAELYYIALQYIRSR
jgi:hypothetical protein